MRKRENSVVRSVAKVIKSKEDYLFYLEADRVALLARELKRPRFLVDEIWKFQRLLRKVEYLKNCGENRLSWISGLQARYRLAKLSIDLGYTIPCNVFGPGLSIAHRGTIVVHPRVRVGENCRIHQGVTLGSGARGLVPTIGNNVFIGPNAVVVGPITIADGIAIGANSYVDKSFQEPNITIAGCPAKKISDRSPEDCWIRATEILRREVSEKSQVTVHARL